MCSGLFKMLPTDYLFIHHISNISIHKRDLALNNLEQLHAIKHNQPTLKKNNSGNDA